MRNIVIIGLLLMTYLQGFSQTFTGKSDSLQLDFGYPVIQLTDTVSIEDENGNGLLEPDESSVVLFTIKNISKYPAKNVTISPEELNNIRGFETFNPAFVGDIPAGGEKLVEVGITTTPRLQGGTANFVFHLYEKGVENDISIVFTIGTTSKQRED
ncbi:MAG: hypothetical protein AAFY71_04400 [Bacteroidota bacterium]